MYNAAIIIFKRSTLPGILKFLPAPHISKIIETGSEEKVTSVYIIECPVMKKPGDNRKIEKLLKNLCAANNISFFIGRNNELYLGSGLEHIENTVGRGNVDEIAAIKALAALIKLSAEKNDNLLKKNMCFLGRTHSFRYISVMSEESAGIFIYEHDGMSSNTREALFEGLMSEKGISAVFTKDLKRAACQCEIILADDTVGLEEYRSVLSGKILIGNNSITGSFEKISQVRLWHEELDGLDEDDPLICFNDEMLGILRHFYKERNPIDFIKRFPYIYMTRD